MFVRLFVVFLDTINIPCAKDIENACRDPMKKLGYAEFNVGPFGSSPLPKGPLIKKWNDIWPAINEIKITTKPEYKLVGTSRTPLTQNGWVL